MMTDCNFVQNAADLGGAFIVVGKFSEGGGKRAEQMLKCCL